MGDDRETGKTGSRKSESGRQQKIRGMKAQAEEEEGMSQTVDPFFPCQCFCSQTLEEGEGNITCVPSLNLPAKKSRPLLLNGICMEAGDRLGSLVEGMRLVAPTGKKALQSTRFGKERRKEAFGCLSGGK